MNLDDELRKALKRHGIPTNAYWMAFARERYAKRAEEEWKDQAKREYERQYPYLRKDTLK